MKRRILHLTVAFLTCTIGLLAYSVSSRNSSGSVINPDFTSEPVATSDYVQSFKPAINVDTSTEMGATLDVTFSLIAPTTWNASIVLTNTGDKVITGYEIEFIESYEFKKDVLSGDGAKGGWRLEPGQSKTIDVGEVGFSSGYSYGKPVGQLQEVTFRIGQLEFDDGSVTKNKRTPCSHKD